MFEKLLPPTCAACGAPVQSRARLLCVDCERAMPWLEQACCPRCALPAPCGSRCPAARLAFDSAWAAAAHAGAARRLVVALKFRSALEVADFAGREIAGRVPSDLVRGAVLVPVPGNPWRRRARGFDHAALIAAAIARNSGLPLALALRRTGPAPRQSGQTARVRTTAGRIEVQAVTEAPLACVLVDDVHTTGATLDACAQALRRAGARHVRAVTFGRTLP